MLEVLAGTTSPLSTLAVHRIAGVGSANGVRLVLERLARQGLISADHRRNAIYYTGNRDHLAWPAVEILANMRRTLLDRISGEVGDWAIPAIHVSIFGSFARGDGGAASDIDVLVIKPGCDDDAFDAQVDHLRGLVTALTGNRCQVFDVTQPRLREHVAIADPLVEAWLHDGVHLRGETLPSLLNYLRSEVTT